MASMSARARPGADRGNPAPGVFEVPDGGEAEGVRVEVEAGAAHLEELVIGVVPCHITQHPAALLQQARKIAPLVRLEVAADDVGGARRLSLWRQQAEDGAAQAFFRRQALGLADGVHEAFGKADFGEALAQRLVDVAQVAAEEVMDAGREEQHGARQLVKMLELLQDVRDALDEQLLVIGLHEVAFFEFNGREALHEAHLGCCQHDTAQAAGGAGKDLVAFRQRHARVDDVPGAAAGRRVFEFMGKGRGKAGIPQQQAGARGTAVDSLQQEITSFSGKSVRRNISRCAAEARRRALAGASGCQVPSRR